MLLLIPLCGSKVSENLSSLILVIQFPRGRGRFQTQAVKLFTLSQNIVAAEFSKKAINCLPFVAPPFLSAHLFMLIQTPSEHFLAICSVHLVLWGKTPVSARKFGGEGKTEHCGKSF